MRKSLAVVAVLLLAAAAAGVLAGCGGPGGQKGEEGKVKLRFASWDNAQDLDKQQKLVDQFNASQGRIQVSLEAYGSDYDTKISAGMGSGDSPDVLYMWNYPAYYQGLEPLDSYVEKEGEAYKKNFYDTLWPYNSMNGVIYGIPVGFTTHALFYNKDIFAKAGLQEPTDGWTWDDLKKAAGAITQKLDGVKGFAFQMKPDPYDFEMYLWSNGTAYADQKGNLDGYLNSPKAAQALGLFQDMEKEGYAVATQDNGTDEFRSGQAAMYIYGDWAVADLKADGMNYGIVEIPSFPGAKRHSVSILSSSGVAISKDSKHKEEAWEFIKYWTGKELNKARIGYELPVLKTVIDSQKLLEDPAYKPFYAMLEQSAGFTPSSFVVKDWSKLSDALSLAFEQVFNPTTLEDPQAVLNQAVSDMR